MAEKFLNQIRSGIINTGLKFISVDEKIIHMFLDTGAKSIRPIVINVITKAMFTKFLDLLKNEKNYTKEGQVHNGTIQGIPISVIRTEMGAPNASILMECLKRTGAKIIIRAEICGSLNPSINIGHVFIPKDALIGDGTCPYYLRKTHQQISKISVNMELYQAIWKIIQEEIPDSVKYLHTGTVWTTDALFCETTTEIKYWQDLGAEAVDMETSVMYLLSSLFQLPSISILGVTDIPNSDYDLFETNKIHPEMGNAVSRVVQLVIRILSGINARLTQK